MVIIMEKIIYVQLLNEGSIAYRPVPAIEIENNIYMLQGFDIYDTEDEEWEFLPGSYVLVEEQVKGDKNVSVAIKQQSPI
jgi:hypothetical protein